MVKATVESYIEEDAGALTEEIEYQIKGAAGTLYVGASSAPRIPILTLTMNLSLSKEPPRRYAKHRITHTP